MAWKTLETTGKNRNATIWAGVISNLGIVVIHYMICWTVVGSCSQTVLAMSPGRRDTKAYA